MTTSPRLRTLEGGFWLELPPGEGKVMFSVKATNAERVRFVLTPTGTDVADYAKLLGEDRTPQDGFTLVWRYPAEGLSAHLGIEAMRLRHAALTLEAGFTIASYAEEAWEMGGLRLGVIVF